MVERRRLQWLALLASTLAAGAAHAADASDRKFRVHVGQRLTDETNLYRLPAGIDPADLIGADAHRDDRVAASSIAAAGEWERGSQAVVLDTSLAANRFARNGDLDNTSGRGALEWRWRAGSKWTAQLGGRHERALGSFANTDSLEKDLRATTVRHAAARFDATPRYSATFTASESATEHGNALRRRDDVTTRTAAFGVTHHTPRADRVGFELRRARGEHARDAALGDVRSASDYDEHRAVVQLHYLLASKLVLDGSAGRVERAYPYGARGDFAGNVWRAALQWQFSVKTEIAVERWQDVKAHLDAESEHFVAAGSALTASWAPIDSVRIALQTSREEQRYIGLTSDELAAPLRHDTPRALSLGFTYRPRERFALDVSYRRETRGSDRPRFDYSAESLALAWDVEF